MAETAAYELRGADFRPPSAPLERISSRDRAKVIRSGLEQAVEAIVPELIRRHSEISLPSPSPAEINRLARLAIGADEGAFQRGFERAVTPNRSFESALVGVVTPVIHWLDEMWKSDACDFFDVTIGIGRLQARMDALASRTAPLIHPPRRALLISVADDTHVFGLRMLGKVFEGAGWDVEIAEARTPAESAKRVASEWFGIVGVSVGLSARVPLAAQTIALVRGASLNPKVGILAGGNAVIAEPDLAVRIGADLFAADAPNAIIAAASLLRAQSSSRTA